MQRLLLLAVLLWIGARRPDSPSSSCGAIFMNEKHTSELQQTNCPARPIPVPLASKPSSSFTEALQWITTFASSFLELGTQNATCSYTVITYRGQTILSIPTGTMSQTSSEAPTANTPFRIGSISKVFTSLLTISAYEDGLLKSLDDPVEKYYPAFKPQPPLYNPKQTIDPITFRQLLSQLSGLQREVPCGDTCNYTNAQAVELISKTPLLWPPNLRPSYSNLAFALLGNLVADIFYKTDFETAVMKRILQPLGLHNTGVTITPEVAAAMPVGYNADGTSAPLVDLGWVSPAGQLFASANDLTTLLLQFSNSTSDVNTNGFSASGLTEALLPIFQNPDLTTGFGTPWENTWISNYLVRTKGGNIYGFSGIIGVIPELEVTIATLWNGAANEFNWLQYALGTFIPALVAEIDQYQPTFPQPPSPTPYVGSFQLEGETFLIVGTLQGQLMANTPYGFVWLAYLGNNAFSIRTITTQSTCMQTELLALFGQYLYYSFSSNETAITIPGLAPGVTFVKETSADNLTMPKPTSEWSLFKKYPHTRLL